MSNNYTKDFFIDDKKRSLVLILPGGGYHFTAEIEATPVAKFFNNLDYHSTVYYYRENKLLYPDIYLEAKTIIDKYLAHPLVSNIIIIGFSAGGHFASFLLTTYSDCFIAGILCYPVISSNKKIRHEDSFVNLIGHTSDYQLLKLVSTETLVTNKTPPIFIWHTKTDSLVPYENSVVFVEALKKHDVSHEFWLFPKGEHGLSLVTKDTANQGVDVIKYLAENKDIKIWTTYLETWLNTIK